MSAGATPSGKGGSMDDLESHLVGSWQEVSRSIHRFLVLLREFDRREGWRVHGNNDCAEWLNWRCGISRTTAQEKVRVARKLAALPQIDEAFRRGDLSYSKVRALTRVATDADEVELLEYALDASASQLETYCRRLRNADIDAASLDARRLHEARSLIRLFREDGSGLLSVDLPREELELVMKALEFVGSTLPEDSSRSLFAKGADALVQMARDTLAGRRDTPSAPDEYRVVVHVDADALTGQGGRADLPTPTVRRLCCDGAVVPLTQGPEREPLSVGRQQRTVPVGIKRALVARDGGCRFPGCHHERYLEAHHVRHWCDGGETSLDNLLLLCFTHHKLVHEGGFRIEADVGGGYTFLRPDGRPLDGAGRQGEPRRVEDGRETYRRSRSSAEDGQPGSNWVNCSRDLPCGTVLARSPLGRRQDPVPHGPQGDP